MNGSDSKTEEASATDARQAPYPSWDEVPWGKVEAHVSKLQTRIARATREGRVEEARKAQRILVASLDAELIAVRAVTSNRGKKTVGSPKIRGFANYHRRVCASVVFHEIDHIIYIQLRRWARRRHPKKRKRYARSFHMPAVD